MNYLKLSKEVSYALRHAPWEYELELDEEGFTSIKSLLSSLDETGHYDHQLTKDDLEEMIRHSDKKRHEIIEDRIRALYGHSIPMHLKKSPIIPPDTLYHGTTHKALYLIKEKGLLPMNRQYVHLSKDVQIANSVGKRRDDNPIILVINAKKAFENQIKFYEGNDKVILADYIPREYIQNLN